MKYIPWQRHVTSAPAGSMVSPVAAGRGAEKFPVTNRTPPRSSTSQPCRQGTAVRPAPGGIEGVPGPRRRGRHRPLPLTRTNTGLFESPGHGLPVQDEVRPVRPNRHSVRRQDVRGGRSGHCREDTRRRQAAGRAPTGLRAIGRHKIQRRNPRGSRRRLLLVSSRSLSRLSFSLGSELLVDVHSIENQPYAHPNPTSRLNRPTTTPRRSPA